MSLYLTRFTSEYLSKNFKKMCILLPVIKGCEIIKIKSLTNFKLRRESFGLAGSNEQAQSKDVSLMESQLTSTSTLQVEIKN